MADTLKQDDTEIEQSESAMSTLVGPRRFGLEENADMDENDTMPLLLRPQ